MKLELAVDGDRTPWRPDAETESDLREMLAAWGPTDGILEVVLTDDRVIRELNRRYRQKDRATDVLSFSYLEGHESSREELLKADRLARDFCSESLDGEVLVGQVLISVETMRGRDVRPEHTDGEEFHFLAVHGMLHTLGYDHAREEDAREMERAQEAILSSHRIPSPGESKGGAST